MSCKRSAGVSVVSAIFAPFPLKVSLTKGSLSPPQLFEPCRVGGRVLDGVLNIPVSEIILNEARIRALVGESEAASVAQHVRMGEQGQGRCFAVCYQEQVDGGSVQGLALLADKERPAGGLHPGAFFQPNPNRP